MSSGRPQSSSQPALLDVPTGGTTLATQPEAHPPQGKSCPARQQPSQREASGFRPARLQWTVHSSLAASASCEELLSLPWACLWFTASDLKPDAFAVHKMNPFLIKVAVDCFRSTPPCFSLRLAPAHSGFLPNPEASCTALLLFLRPSIVTVHSQV